ncbi:MAG: hypothetical protein OXS50_07080 [Gammaproteobacteria bacterium]|nr:hypothetical protein [Gammaproteobacteria bacterium]
MTRDEMDQDARVLLDAHNENERRIVCLSDRLRRAGEALSRFLESPEDGEALNALTASISTAGVASDATALAALRERGRLKGRLSKEYPYLFGEA